jgi:hypothetical protein
MESDRFQTNPFLFLSFQKAKLLKQKKDEGNTVFKMSNWSAAYEIYTEALGIDPCNKFTNAKLYCNRAIVAAKVSVALLITFRKLLGRVV